MKNKLILLISVLVGIVAFWLSASYLDRMREELYAGTRKVKVIAASRDLPIGTVIQPEDLGYREVFESTVGENAFRTEDQSKLIGKRLRYTVKARNAILWSHVDMPQSKRHGQSEFAPAIPKGMRAISLSISGAASLSGMLRPGDWVDILGTFSFPSPSNPMQAKVSTITLLPNALVLATGDRHVGQYSAEAGSRGYSTVTFAVTPEYIEILTFAQQSGELYLALRNPNEGLDAEDPETLESLDFDTLQYKLPELIQQYKSFIRIHTP